LKYFSSPFVTTFLFISRQKVKVKLLVITNLIQLNNKDSFENSEHSNFSNIDPACHSDGAFFIGKKNTPIRY